MSNIQTLFPTLLYRAELPTLEKLNMQLHDVALELAANDIAGQRWCEKHGYPGYTSFATQPGAMSDVPAIARLVKIIDKHTAEFAKELH